MASLRHSKDNADLERAFLRAVFIFFTAHFIYGALIHHPSCIPAERSGRTSVRTVGNEIPSSCSPCICNCGHEREFRKGLIKRDKPFHRIPTTISVQKLQRQVQVQSGVEPGAHLQTEAYKMPFHGIPADEYFDRAAIVFSHRAASWTMGLAEGQSCAGSSERCSLGLLCVGPRGMEICRKQLSSGAACDAVYRVCQSGLVCEKGVCTKMSAHHEKCTAAGITGGMYSQCTTGLFCDPAALVCQEKRARGERCTSVYPCQDSLVCNCGVCRLPTDLGHFKNLTFWQSKLHPTAPFDEHNGSSGAVAFPIAGVECASNYCAKKRLLIRQHAFKPELTGTEVRTPFISSERVGTISCPPGMLVNEVLCRTSACGEVALGCSYGAPRVRVVDNETMDSLFASRWHPRAYCKSGYMLQGVTCWGALCGELQLHCVLTQVLPYNVLLSDRLSCWHNSSVCTPAETCISGQCQVQRVSCDPALPGSCREGAYCNTYHNRCWAYAKKWYFCAPAFPCVVGLVCDMSVCREPEQLALYVPLTYARANLTRTAPFGTADAGGSLRQQFLIVGFQCEDHWCSTKRLFERRHDGNVDLTGTVRQTEFVPMLHGGTVACPPGMVVDSVFCKGEYCAEVSLGCSRTKPVYRLVRNVTLDTDAFADKTQPILCPNSYYMMGARCEGSFCEKVGLRCVLVESLEGRARIAELGHAGP